MPRAKVASAPIERLMLAIDLSARGDRVLARAARLPVAPGARLTVIHAVSTRKLADASLRAEMARHVTSLCDALHAHRIDAEVDGVIAVGAPHEVVVAQAKQRGAELVAIGDHGARPFRDFLGLGTTADRIVRTSHVPVLVVKRPATTGYTKVGLALDLPVSAATARAAESALRISREPRRVAAIHALNNLFESKYRRGGISDSEILRIRAKDEDEARTRLHAWLAANVPGRSPGRVIIRSGDPRWVVTRALAQRFDLVAAGAHGRSNLARWFLGSVAETVLREASCDVLVARASP